MSTSQLPSIFEFLPKGSESDDGPVISAAGNSDSTALLTILQKAQALSVGDRSEHVLDQVHDAMLDGRWDTPLLRAVAESRTGNVQTLLRYGANPNGIPRAYMAEHARGYRRLSEQCATATDHDLGVTALRWPLREEDVVDVATPILPLTEEKGRSFLGVSPFCDDPSTTLPCVPGDLLHSLVVAAELASEEIFEMLQNAGASSRFWQMNAREAVELFAGGQENALEPSALCVSTPLHAVITAGNTNMLRALLEKGFDPNTRALITGPKALTPMHLAISMGNMDAYAILASNPKADVDLRTPVYGVHILHFAAVHLMPEQLALINLSLAECSVTALNHTLLHVASLPIDESCIQTLAPKVQQSLHFVREMAFAETDCLPQDPKTQQMAMCKHLINILGPAEIGKVDVHGNTALHYLAGTKDPDTELIAWIRMREGAEDVWTTRRNIWGWTPADLSASAGAVVERPIAGNRRGSARRGRGRGRGYMFERGRALGGGGDSDSEAAAQQRRRSESRQTPLFRDIHSLPR